jgi:hypothetical protein
VPDLPTASELGAVLGRRLTRKVGRSIRVDLADLDQLLCSGPAQQGLSDIVAALTGEPLLQKQLRLDARTAANQRVKHELLEIMARVPELATERALLESTPDSPIPHPPGETLAGTTSWPVYELAIRAACIWWTAKWEERRLAAKQLAGQAFGDTKGWTDQRRLAFANLVRRPFDQAVDESDIPIRLSGPLVWVMSLVHPDVLAGQGLIDRAAGSALPQANCLITKPGGLEPNSRPRRSRSGHNRINVGHDARTKRGPRTSMDSTKNPIDPKASPCLPTSPPRPPTTRPAAG